jgi:hypothetical protein
MGGDLQAKVDTLRTFKVFSTFSNLHLRKMALHFERRKFLPHTSNDDHIINVSIAIIMIINSGYQTRVNA